MALGKTKTPARLTAILLLLAVPAIFLCVIQSTSAANTSSISGGSPFRIEVEPKNATICPGGTLSYKATITADLEFEEEIKFDFAANALGVNVLQDLGVVGPPYPSTFRYNFTVPENVPMSVSFVGILKGVSGSYVEEARVQITIDKRTSPFESLKMFYNLTQLLKGALDVLVAPTAWWAPPVEGVMAAGLLAVITTSVVSSLASAIANPSSFPSQKFAQKVNEMLPAIFRKWLNAFIKSKNKMSVEPYAGSPFAFTTREKCCFVVSASVMTVVWSYVKSESLSQLLYFIPIVLATSVLIDLVTDIVVKAVARRQGVWGEHIVWYYGLSIFVSTSLLFKFPLSSPKRICYHSPKFTKRSMGLVSTATVLTPLVLAIIFFALMMSGLTPIAGTGVVICLTVAVYDSLPIPLMNGKGIYDWDKRLWAVLFELVCILLFLSILVL